MSEIRQNGPSSGSESELVPELNTAPDGIALTEPHAEPAVPLSRLRLYVGALFLLPFAYMAICFFVMRSDFFLRRTQNIYLANMGYGLRLRNADCQVLVFGDSSAMEGVDPGILSKETGLSACNIAEPAGVMRLNGTMVLDTYLERNPRPKYLILLLSPNGIRPTWLHEGNYEAVLMRVRERPDLGLLYAVIRHADDILSAIGTSGRFVLTWVVHSPLPEGIVHKRDNNRGRYPDTSERMTTCLTDARINPPSREWVDGFRTRYSVEGTHVLVDVTPVPDCDPAQATYMREFAPDNGIIDNRLEIYPTHWYTQSGHFHLGSSEGWGHLTARIAEQINTRQKAGRTH